MAILDFLSKRGELFLFHKSPRCFLPSFESADLSVQKKLRKIYFQDGLIAAMLEFWSEGVLVIFDLKSPRCFLPIFESVGLPVQEKKRNIYFQDGRNGGHLEFPIGTRLASYILQVTAMLSTKFWVNWPSGLAEEAKNRFSRWWPLPSWISNRNDFSFLLIYKSPRCFLLSVESVGPGV